MHADNILQCFNKAANDPAVESLFVELNTVNRPALPEDEEYTYHDWVLVRRKGVELGFADSEYHNAAARFRWGHGELLLTQAYFYTSFDDVQPFTGELPFGLAFTDGRDTVRQKLVAFEATRHSYLTDSWDMQGYRLTVQYGDQGTTINRIACRVLPTPIAPETDIPPPALTQIQAQFGASLSESSFQAIWGDLFGQEQVAEAKEDREVDLTDTLGAELYFARAKELAIPLEGLPPQGLVFAAIKFYRNRDRESAGWRGELPQGLAFDDSPQTLLDKLGQPAAQSDSTLTGYALWHYPSYSLHVLYSHVDNRLLRINLMAPGYWTGSASE